MTKLNRRESFWKSRREYLDSLRDCTAIYVTELDCSLCTAVHDYCYCPHILAVRGQMYFSQQLKAMSNAGLEEPKDHVARLLKDFPFQHVVHLLRCHPTLYNGYLNDDTPNIPVNDIIFNPMEINGWVSKCVDYACKKLDNSKTYDVTCTYVGRKKDYVELWITTKRNEEEAAKEKEERERAEEEALQTRKVAAEEAARAREEEEKRRKQEEKEIKQMEKEKERLMKEEARLQNRLALYQKKKAISERKKDRDTKIQHQEELREQSALAKQKERDVRVSADTLSSSHRMRTRGKSKYLDSSNV